ncbi:hypothetical protein Peur_060995 [Populus x canadensis]
MQMLYIFTDPKSPLYDQFRDQNHQPPTLLDLDYGAGDPNPTIANQLYSSNLRVIDCLDNTGLRYTYQNVEIPWLESKPIPRRLGKKAAETKTALTPITAFPLVLDKTMVTVVSRPKKSRSRKEKEEEDEVLVIEGIEYDNGKFVKFDVFINDDVEIPSKPENTEFAGSFVNVSHKHAKKSKTRLILGITELLEDLETDGDDSIVVALVPRSNTISDPVVTSGV